MTDPTRWDALALARHFGTPDDVKHDGERIWVCSETRLRQFAAAVEAQTVALTADEQREVAEKRKMSLEMPEYMGGCKNLLAIIDRLTKGAPE